MATLAKKGNSKPTTVDWLLDKRPTQHVVITAIQHLYSREVIDQFLTDYMGLLRSDEAARRGKAPVTGNDVYYLRRTEAIVRRAFDADDGTVSEATRAKWQNLIDGRKPRGGGASTAVPLGKEAEFSIALTE